ncbi:MAG: type III secretion system chaperone [Pseudochelatococcus sp.]|jgi:hypothetical protein|uniref:type III secretion system chaperone n=1 Tax=Pseudochelatococcus sp. TaxID=2020869 RepID=UPI003D8BC223
MSTFENLIVGLAREAGIILSGTIESPVEFRYDGLPVVISEDLRSGVSEVIVHAQLGEVPREHELEVYRILLEANVLWSATADATLGVNSDTRQVIICYRMPLAGLEPESFAAVIRFFVDVARKWADFIEAARTEGHVQYPADIAGETLIRI